MAGFGIAGASAGGRVLASPLSGKISALSADGSQWEEVAVLAKPRFFHRLLPLADGRLVAVGGSSRKGQIPELELITPGAKSASPTTAAIPNTSTDSKQPTERGGAAWPQWRGPNRDGVSAESGWRKDWPNEGLPVLWRAQVGVGMSSCVVADGRLITQGNDGSGNDHVIALDAASGAELWRVTFPCKTDSHEMPIVPSGPGATPTIAGGHVFALSREGDLLCIEAATGQLAWKKNLVADLGGKRPVYGYAQSPLIADGRLFLDIGSEKNATGSTVALDAATGDVRWRGGSGEAGYSSARLLERDGRKLVAMFKGEALDIFDPADGRVVATHRTTARDFTNAATPAFVGHRVLVSNTGTDLAALLDWENAPGANVRPAWTHKQFALLFNSAIAHDGSLFGFNEKRRGHHEFTCLDATTGETRWVSDAVQTGTFILADGHWIFLTRDGELALAPAAAAELKCAAKFKALEGKCYATPTLAAGRIYARSNAGEVVAFDARAK
jgi:outer membrane protein assembly factor BamB